MIILGYYDNAQVCLNGHAITPDISSREFLAPFCSKCGAETITSCPSCHAPIKGTYNVPGVAYLSHYHPPAYCDHCGKPFPWTQAKLDAAKELLADLDELSSDEQEKLNSSFPDIMSETPRTTVAANRISKYMKKISPTAKECIKTIFYDVAAEVAKKIIWPNS